MSGQPNVRTTAFKRQLAALPKAVQELAQGTFELFLQNPQHPSLRLHRLEDNRQGSHRPHSISVSVSRMYRAIYVVDGATNVWYWIGTHADYDQFTGG